MKRTTVKITVVAVLTATCFNVFSQKNGDVFSPDGMEMIYVEGKKGDIFGGSDMEAFYIGKYPVTQKQWKAIMESNSGNTTEDNYPVQAVSWDEAQNFIGKLCRKTKKNYRLPTEAEWEYAAKGGNISQGYEYAGSNDINKVAWYIGNSGDDVNPAGSKAPNELGIYDMSGNVWEWCRDIPGNDTSLRILRGGSHHDSERNCTIENNRHRQKPNVHYNNFGFRLVISSF